LRIILKQNYADLAIFQRNNETIQKSIFIELKAACSFDIEKRAGNKSQLEDFRDKLE